MSDQLPARKPGIVIEIGNVPLAAKLDALGAAIDAVRKAHADTATPRCQSAMERSQAALADAILSINDRRVLELPEPRKRLQVGR
jgi:hypothetical protein